MNKIGCITRRYYAILAFAISAIVFLPEAAFTEGAVVGYAHGNFASTLSDSVQLEYLTHVMAVERFHRR